MEKRKANDLHATDRVELLGNAKGDPLLLAVGKQGEVDPYASELPDIDAEEDLKAIRNRDKEIVKRIYDRMMMLLTLARESLDYETLRLTWDKN
jgi:hypothetical protein